LPQWGQLNVWARNSVTRHGFSTSSTCWQKPYRSSRSIAWPQRGQGPGATTTTSSTSSGGIGGVLVRGRELGLEVGDLGGLFLDGGGQLGDDGVLFRDHGKKPWNQRLKLGDAAAKVV